MTEYSAIDPAALKGMITSFQDDKNTLGSARSSYLYRFAGLDLDTTPFGGLSDIEGWMKDQLPGLKRRYSLALGLEHGGHLHHVVRVPEPVTSLAETQKEARRLAGKLNAIKKMDDKNGSIYHDVAEQLADHKDDPDYCAAFYAALRPPELATEMPSRLVDMGDKEAPGDLKTFSAALGAATRAPFPPTGFSKVRKLFTSDVPQGDTPASWDRAAMLRFGTFDPDFLADATRGAVLHQVAEDPSRDFHGPAHEASVLGLPQTTVALALDDLVHSGSQSATYDAIARMGDPKNPDIEGNLQALFRSVRYDRDGQTALGSAIDLGSGVRGHTDAQGVWHADPERHNDYEDAFAFSAMLAAGSESGAVNKYFNGAFKRDMGRLAASYPQEMLSSGNGLNQDITDSLLGVPTDYTSIPGINPSFVLSGSDAYKFLKTFAGSDSYSAPYDEVMGSLQQGTLVKCARADSQALRAGKQDPENYENGGEAFGNIKRLLYDSEMKIRGDMDASDEANREALKRLVFLGTELAGEPEMGFAAKVSWRTGMWAVKEFGGDAFVDWGPERTEGVEDRNYEMLAQTRYTMTSTLLEGGWKATTPLPEDLRGPDGKLASFEELARDGKLQDFDDWVNEQRGGAVSLQQKQAHASGLMDTAQADGVAHAVDGG